MRRNCVRYRVSSRVMDEEDADQSGGGTRHRHDGGSVSVTSETSESGGVGDTSGMAKVRGAFLGTSTNGVGSGS